jgi:hypothetical protein
MYKFALVIATAAVLMMQVGHGRVTATGDWDC